MASEQILAEPFPGIADLRSPHAVTIVAALIALLLAGADLLIGPELVVVSLLAFPPLLAAGRASPAETAAIGALCVGLALLSTVWNEGAAHDEFPVRMLVVLIGALASVLIASLRQSLRREHAAAELLAETGLVLQESLRAQDRAGQIAQLAVPELADAATVDLSGPDSSIVRTATAVAGGELRHDAEELRASIPVDPGGAHPAALAIRTGEAQLIDPIDEAQLASFGQTEAELELLRRARPSSVLAVPLKARGAVLGAISLWVLDPRRRYDRRSRNAALRLAQSVALALDNARLHEQQVHIARVLQSSLRPRSLPSIEGFEAAARFQAAGDAQLVGGDFFDAFAGTGDSTWSVVIGDVCGKGPEAAALTALARHAVRASSTPGTAPSEVLQALHRSIAEEGEGSRFCTAALVRIASPADPGTARITLALGGHPRPLLVHADGFVEALGRTGTLLGVLPSPVIFETEARLEPGDSLVLYTDGLLEASDRAEAEDPAWLAAELAAANGGGAEAIAERLARAAIERQGGKPQDDIAVVVLRRTGR